MNSNPTYLGDGVYADFDGFQIWLYIDNGIRKSERIAIEPATLIALKKYEIECYGGSFSPKTEGK